MNLVKNGVVDLLGFLSAHDKLDHILLCAGKEIQLHLKGQSQSSLLFTFRTYIFLEVQYSYKFIEVDFISHNDQGKDLLLEMDYISWKSPIK